jgi:hypothetical protein
MPVILAIQEAEIRRITVQSQSQANSSQDPISKGLLEGLKWQSTCLAKIIPHSDER